MSFSLDLSGEGLLERRGWEGDGKVESGWGREGREKDLVVGEGAGFGKYDREKDMNTGSEGKVRKTLEYGPTYMYCTKYGVRSSPVCHIASAGKNHLFMGAKHPAAKESPDFCGCEYFCMHQVELLCLVC